CDNRSVTQSSDEIRTQALSTIGTGLPLWPIARDASNPMSSAAAPLRNSRRAINDTVFLPVIPEKRLPRVERFARRSCCKFRRAAYNCSQICRKLKSFHAGYEQFEIAEDRRHLVAGVCRSLPTGQAHDGLAAPGNDAIGRQPRTRPVAR